MLFSTVYLAVTMSFQDRSFLTMYFMMLTGSIWMPVSTRARTPAGGFWLLMTAVADAG